MNGRQQVPPCLEVEAGQQAIRISGLDKEHSIERQHATNFAQEAFWFEEMFEHLESRHDLQGCAGKRNGSDVPPDRRNAADIRCDAHGDVHAGGIEETARDPKEVSPAEADVQQSTRSGDFEETVQSIARFTRLIDWIVRYIVYMACREVWETPIHLGQSIVCRPRIHVER